MSYQDGHTSNEHCSWDQRFYMPKTFGNWKAREALRYISYLIIQQSKLFTYEISRELTHIPLSVKENFQPGRQLFIIVIMKLKSVSLTNEMEDGWYIFTKVVPKTTAVRGPAARRNLKYFLVFP